MMRARIRQRFPAGEEPAFHRGDFVPLRDVDLFGEEAEVAMRGTGRDQRCHGEGLRVMPDHVLHEAHVGRGVATTGGIRLRRLGDRNWAKSKEQGAKNRGHGRKLLRVAHGP
jgi:hypothetical protein